MRKVAIVWSEFNAEITRGLLTGARHTLEAAGIPVGDQDIFQVPGAFELPLVALRLAETKRYDAIITLGCVIKGDTMHFEFVSLGVTMGIQQATLASGVPILFGVLTTQNEDQALARSDTKSFETNKGSETANACLQVLNVLERVHSSQSR